MNNVELEKIQKEEETKNGNKQNENRKGPFTRFTCITLAIIAVLVGAGKYNKSKNNTNIPDNIAVTRTTNVDKGYIEITDFIQKYEKYSAGIEKAIEDGFQETAKGIIRQCSCEIYRDFESSDSIFKNEKDEQKALEIIAKLIKQIQEAEKHGIDDTMVVCRDRVIARFVPVARSIIKDGTVVTEVVTRDVCRHEKNCVAMPASHALGYVINDYVALMEKETLTKEEIEKNTLETNSGYHLTLQ